MLLTDTPNFFLICKEQWVIFNVIIEKDWETGSTKVVQFPNDKTVKVLEDGI